jgi:hypothetical protein
MRPISRTSYREIGILPVIGSLQLTGWKPMPPSTHDDDQVQLFSRLLVANQRRLYGFILTLVHDRAAADDILQDVSSLLWQ